MNPCFSIDKSGSRFFWAAWLSNPDLPPNFSGYTRSKEAAIQAVADALNSNQAIQLKAEAASQWRGILHCKYCGSKNLKAEQKSDLPHPRLCCSNCNRFNKWLNQNQLHLFHKLQAEKQSRI
ncbi:hypothetical protein [Leptolyngbya sp. FACHB-16]|uniref:hypothetical protein n=1 Tax=unclassified Leptolyngbya TaxID=2650499 RepID=UPI001683AB2B|nr:hypothetical protein [Leptolyngbya sp. FACHB-16]MBD2154527.1 hypothetical protein [Leptolyngbya sp. FACHB-16]